jgi:outer membrane protein TolC
MNKVKETKYPDPEINKTTKSLIRWLRLGIMLLLVAMIPLLSRAQEVQQFTLKQCIEQALKENNNIVKAKLDTEEGRYMTKEVKSTALPQINVNADLTDNVLRQAFVFPARLGDPSAGPDDYIVLRGGLQYTTSVNVQATQQLFNQSLFTGIKAAKVSEEFYRQNQERTEEEVIYQVALIFYQAASVKAQRVVLESNLVELSKSLNVTTDRFKNGLSRKLDVDRLSVSVTNIKTQLATLQNSYEVLLNQLKLVMGLNTNSFFDIDEPLLVNADSILSNYNPTLLKRDWVWENKIEYKQLSTQLSLYNLERKNYSAGYYPTLSAFANYTYQGQTNAFFLSEDANPIWFDVASIGLKLNISVFDGFRKSAQIQQSKIRRIKTERDLLFTKDQSTMQYENAVKTLQVNFDNYQAQKTNVQLANSIYDITEQNYNQGISPLTDLLQAETSRVFAQSNLIEALLKVKQAEVDLLKASGEIKSLLN